MNEVQKEIFEHLHAIHSDLRAMNITLRETIDCCKRRLKTGTEKRAD